MTRDEIERLNVYAINHTRARRDEHGMDWDYWTFWPASETAQGLFSDGHDYGYYPRIPDEGWVPVKSKVEVPVETLVELLRGLEKAVVDLRGVHQPKKGEDRKQAAWALERELRRLEGVLCKAGGNPHGG